jgi:hypothetical protein
MSEVYNKLEKLYRKYHPAQFNMAIAQLLEIGFRNAAEITDKEINEAKGNALMTDEFWRDTLTLVRDLATSCSPVELMQFIEVEEPFEIRYFAEKVERHKLENAVVYAMQGRYYNDNQDLNEVCAELGLDLDDAELFGFEVDWEKEDAI